MTTPVRFEDPRALLRRYGLDPKRSWGQNFLVSQAAVAAIVEAAVDVPGRRVVEIGAGLGTLTGALLAAGGRVTAVERDREMCSVLRAEFGGADRFSLLEADAAKVDYRAVLGEPRAVIAGNLPYQLTGRLLRVLLARSADWLRAVLMVQEEVAERLIAPCGARARGALSVFCQARCRIRIVRRLGPAAFHPRPKVRSAVVVFDPLDRTIFDLDIDEPGFERVVKAAFSTPRKTLRNALVSGGLGLPDQVDRLLADAGIDPGLRPGRLEVGDFASLARLVQTAADRV